METLAAETVGYVAVESGRLLMIDTEVVGDWTDGEPVDHCYDLVAWGEDEEALSKALGLPLPVLLSAASESHATDVQAEALALRRKHGWQVAVELRPRSHYWQSLTLAGAPGRGGEIRVGDRAAVILATPAGRYPVRVERGPDGEPLRLVVDFTTGE